MVKQKLVTKENPKSETKTKVTSKPKTTPKPKTNTDDDIPLDTIIEIDDDKLLKEIRTTLESKSIDTNTAVSNLVLVKIARKLNTLNHRIEALISRYDNIERLLYPKVYPPEFLENGLINPKVLIAGANQKSLLDFVDGIDTIRIAISKNIESLEMHNLFKSASRELCLKCSKKFVFYQQFMIESEQVLKAIKMRVAGLLNNLRVRIPKKRKAVYNARAFRKLLLMTQSIGRETEVLFTYFLKAILYEHGQIRRDYSNLQTQTNAIYSALVVTDAEILMDGINLAHSLKEIIKALYNIMGDLEALKVIVFMLMRKQDNPVQLQTHLTKLLDKGG